MQGLTARCQVERTSSEWLPHRTADHRGSPGCAKRYPQSPDHRDALVMHGAAKVRGAHVQQRLPPRRLWPGAAMIENILWFTIGALLGLIVFFYDGSTILS